MAAVSNQAATEKRTTASAVQRTSPVYTRTITYALTNGETAGTADITGFTIPANTLVMGATVKFSVDQGATATFKWTLKTDNLDLSTALADNSTATKALNVFVPRVSTVDQLVTYTTAAAAVTGATVTMTFVLCPINAATADYTTYTV